LLPDYNGTPRTELLIGELLLHHSKGRMNTTLLQPAFLLNEFIG
jgi:hypothetical protein